MHPEQPIRCKWHNSGCAKLPNETRTEEGTLFIGTVMAGGSYYERSGILITPTSPEHGALGVLEIFVPDEEVPALMERLKDRMLSLTEATE
jgi:hypothetical protein